MGVCHGTACTVPCAVYMRCLLCPAQPFIDPAHDLQGYFPDRQWAIMIPAVLLVLLVTFATAFIAWVLIKKARKQAAKKRSD